MGYSMSIAKRWCFTINNPTFEDEQLLIGTPSDGAQAKLGHVEYMIFQEERGENGTLHWQGFLILKTREKMSWLKRNINPRAHWEVARGTNEQARDYCRKDDTYTGGLRHEYGKFPERAPIKKKDERIQEAAEELDLLKEGYKRPSEIPSMTLMQCGFIAAMKELTADVLGPYRPTLKVLTLVGPPGCGKSFAIQKHFPQHGRAIYGNNGVWFQNPTSDVMVFEEFCGQIPLQRMLQLLDPYPLALEVKGRMAPALYTKVIITSNTPPSEWYNTVQKDGTAVTKRDDAVRALWDRLGYSSGDYIPVRDMGTYIRAPDGCTIEQLREGYDKATLHWKTNICDVAEDITDSNSDVEHEELPDDPPSESDSEEDEQHQRRDIGYADH